MADGKGCTCGAYDQSECACDADWTPQELIDARAELARLRAEIASYRRQVAELETAQYQADLNYQAEIERLRLTDAEREAVAAGEEHCFYASCERMADKEYKAKNAKWAATLRGLLNRLGPIYEND